MAYTLEAILGTTTTLQTVLGRQASLPAVLVPLAQGVAMVPATGELFDALGNGTSDRPLGFWQMPGGFDEVLAGWSVAGPIGYVEAEFFGGDGRQRSALWLDGHLAFGPAAVDDGEPWPPEGTPISQVLVRLGVDRTGFFDEFDAAGLSRHRRTGDWLPR